MSKTAARVENFEVVPFPDLRRSALLLIRRCTHLYRVGVVDRITETHFVVRQTPSRPAITKATRVEPKARSQTKCRNLQESSS